MWSVLLLLQIVFYFTCVGSLTLLLFTFSRTDHIILGVEAIANAI